MDKDSHGAPQHHPHDSDGSSKSHWKQRLMAYLTGFCLHTSAHGLGNIVRSSHAVSKLGWLALFVSAQVGITWQLTSILLKYYSYPKQEVSHVSQDPVPFPDVTVCNLEPLVAAEAFAMSEDPSTETYEYAYNKMPEIRKLLNKTSDLKYFSIGRVSSTKGFYENIDVEERKASSHQLKDLIIGCTYAGSDCNPNIEELFTYLPDGTYYNCYTFTAHKVSEIPTGTGPDMGLSLILFLDNTNGSSLPGTYDLLSNVKQGAGARVTIHNQGTLPSPLTQGFDIMPGHSTAVSLSKTKIERLPDPYGNCSKSYYQSYSPEFRYSASSCMLLSAQSHIFNNCGCLSVNLPVPEKLNNESYCGFYDYNPETYLDHIECEPTEYINFYSNVSDKGCCEWCHASCRTYSYDMVIAESYWPNKRYHDSFFFELIESRPDRDSLRAYTNLVDLKSGGTFSNTSIIIDNFARLNIYFSSSEVLVRKQVPSYEGSNLLSDVGGTLGLWAGLSFITVFEVLFLLIKLTAIPFSKDANLKT